MSELDAKVAGWLARINDRLFEMVEFNPGYGTFYISEIRLSFDGEDVKHRLVSNESGYFDIVIDD